MDRPSPASASWMVSVPAISAVPVKWACRTGVCHTCESALFGGSMHYDPEPLDPPSEGNVLICCSRPETEVELDL